VELLARIQLFVGGADGRPAHAGRLFQQHGMEPHVGVTLDAQHDRILDARLMNEHGTSHR
jgi:hypothetical protein